MTLMHTFWSALLGHCLNQKEGRWPCWAGLEPGCVVLWSGSRCCLPKYNLQFVASLDSALTALPSQLPPPSFLCLQVFFCPADLILLLPATCLSLFPSDPCTYHLPARATLPTAAGSLARQPNSRSSQPEPAWIPLRWVGLAELLFLWRPFCVVSFGCVLLLAGCWPVSSPPEHGAVSSLYGVSWGAGHSVLQIPKCQWKIYIYIFFSQKLHMAQLLSSYSEAYPKTRICDEFESSLYSFTFKTLCYREFKTSVRVDKSKMDLHSPISLVSTIINFPANLISSECPYPTSFWSELQISYITCKYLSIFKG